MTAGVILTGEPIRETREFLSTHLFGWDDMDSAAQTARLYDVIAQFEMMISDGYRARFWLPEIASRDGRDHLFEPASLAHTHLGYQKVVTSVVDS